MSLAEVCQRAAPPGLPRPGHGAGDEHAPLLDGRRRRPVPPGRHVAGVDAARGAPRARSSPPATARPATTCPCSSPPPSAERVDGGYRFTGHKIFGSLTPVWTRLGIHAMDAATRRARRSSTPSCPATRRATRIEETWDTLGMRATRSDDTVLDGAFVPGPVHRARRCPPARADLFVLAIFAWAELTFGSIYSASPSARCDLAVDGVKTTHRRSPLTRSMAYHPEVQHSVAEMVLELEAHAAARGADRRGLVERRRPRRAVADRSWSRPSTTASRRAKKVVDLAMTSPAAAGMFKRNELERLYRDVRCGGFHPANSPAGPRDRRQDGARRSTSASSPRWG